MPNTSSTSIPYDAYALRNTSDAADCVDVTLSVLGCDDDLSSVAYLDSFNPEAPASSFLGGNNTIVCSDTVPYQVLVPAGRKSNTFSPRGSVLKDGTGAEGSVSVSSAAGKSYSGPVYCLRVDGDDATLIAAITGGNQDPRFTEAQLRKLGGCPAPGSKATNALSSGHTSVVDTPDPVPPV